MPFMASSALSLIRLASVALVREAGEGELMGHSKGRDNAKIRAKRRRKTERLALAKQPSHEATARPGKKAKKEWEGPRGHRHYNDRIIRHLRSTSIAHGLPVERCRSC